MSALQMESVTYLEQEVASPAYLAIQFLMQVLYMAMHILCNDEKHKNAEPAEVCRYQLKY
jgi:hypothetical protein